MAHPRDVQTRIRDTRERLASDVDAWVATGSADGPWLVPLSFSWDGEALLFATDTDTPTVRRLRTQPRVRIALGHTRDVVIVDGIAEIDDIGAVFTDDAVADYVHRGNSDPRTWADIGIRVRPDRIQAWREENELRGRTIVRDGEWLT